MTDTPLVSDAPLVLFTRVLILLDDCTKCFTVVFYNPEVLQKMKLRYLSIFAAMTLCSVVALAQAQDGYFQVRYASNLPIGDSVVNATNTGASSTTAFPNQNGSICMNVYTFSPDEQLISCCTCPITPDGLVSLSARNDLISNTLTPGVPTSIVVKLLGSTGAPACNASTVGNGTNNLALGLAAWGTTIHELPVTPGSPATTYGVTETAFTNATLSGAELNRITTLCGFIQTNGSGFGICKSCRFGGLAATE